MVDQRVAAEKQNGVGTPYIPPMTRRLKCRIDSEQRPYTCMLPEHKPVRRGREMIDLLAVEEPKPEPAMPPISRMIKDVIIRKNHGRGLLFPSASN